MHTSMCDPYPQITDNDHPFSQNDLSPVTGPLMHWNIVDKDCRDSDANHNSAEDPG